MTARGEPSKSKAERAAIAETIQGKVAAMQKTALGGEKVAKVPKKTNKASLCGFRLQGVDRVHGVHRVDRV